MCLCPTHPPLRLLKMCINYLTDDGYNFTVQEQEYPLQYSRFNILMPINSTSYMLDHFVFCCWRWVRYLIFADL